MKAYTELTLNELQARQEQLEKETSATPQNKPGSKHFGVGPTMRVGSDAEQGEDAFRKWVNEKYHISLGELKQTMHRDPVCLDVTKDTVKAIRTFFEIPDSHRIGLVNGGGHQAMESALQNFAHQDRHILVEQGGVFKDTWKDDVSKLYASAGKQDHVTNLPADGGAVPADLASRPNGIYCGTINETTKAIAYNAADWENIGKWRDKDKNNLVILDATSGLGSMNIQWDKVDVVAFPPTKAINGAPAGTGFIVANERAINLLKETPAPAWPVLKGSALFEGNPNGARSFKEPLFDDPKNPNKDITVINTIVPADFAETTFHLEYMQRTSSLGQSIVRAGHNLKTLETILAAKEEQAKKDGSPYLAFRVEDISRRSQSVAVLDIVDPEVPQAKKDDHAELMYKLLGKDKMTHRDPSIPGADVAWDLRTFPEPDKSKGIRTWIGSVRDSNDLAPLVDWLEWSAKKAKSILIEQAKTALIEQEGIRGHQQWVSKDLAPQLTSHVARLAEKSANANAAGSAQAAHQRINNSASASKAL